MLISLKYTFIGALATFGAIVAVWVEMHAHPKCHLARWERREGIQELGHAAMARFIKSLIFITSKNHDNIIYYIRNNYNFGSKNKGCNFAKNRCLTE